MVQIVHVHVFYQPEVIRNRKYKKNFVEKNLYKVMLIYKFKLNTKIFLSKNNFIGTSNALIK